MFNDEVQQNTSLTIQGYAAWQLERTVNNFWLHIFKFCDGNGLLLYALIPHFLMVATYWIVGSFFTYVDLTSKPHFVAKFKVPDPGADQVAVVTRRKLLKTVKQVLFNQIIVGTAMFCCAYKIKMAVYSSGLEEFRIRKFIGDIILGVILEEIIFFYLHRIFHQYPWLYVRYHKQHHEWTTAVALSTLYCHPVEHVFTNMLPVLMAPLLLDQHCLTFWVWCPMSSVSGVMLHSGYHLPFMQPPEFHHYHHMKFNENYGILGFMDRLYGTDKRYRKSKWYRRQRFLFSFTPIDE